MYKKIFISIVFCVVVIVCGSKDAGGAVLPFAVQLAPNITEQHQSMLGVGAALTESSVLAIHSIRNATQRQLLLETLFSPRRAPWSSRPSAAHVLGANFAAVRVPISASDFSLSWWTFDDSTAPDWNLTNFSIRKTLRDGTEKILKDILQIRGAENLFVVATPWTAPAWLKRQNSDGKSSLCGGAFNSSHRQNFRVYAKFLVRVAIEFQAQLGVPLSAMTLQNEPLNSNSGYPTMLLRAEEETQLAMNVIQELEANEKEFSIAPPPKILLFDHNWDNVAYPVQVMSSLQRKVPSALIKKHVLGAAFHCYAGQPYQTEEFSSQFPDFQTTMTECSGGAWAPNFKYKSSLVLKWNLALNSEHGPKRSGGCGNCRGVVTINEDGTVVYNEDYVALAHLGAALQHRQCVRIGVAGETKNVSAEAFLCDADRFITMMFAINGAVQEITIRHLGCTAVLKKSLPSDGGLVTLRFANSPAPDLIQWFVTNKDQSEVLSKREDVKFVC